MSCMLCLNVSLRLSLAFQTSNFSYLMVWLLCGVTPLSQTFHVVVVSLLISAHFAYTWFATATALFKDWINLPDLFRLLLFRVLSSDNNSVTWHRLHSKFPSTLAVCAAFNLRRLYSNAEKCWHTASDTIYIQWDNGFHFALGKSVTNKKWKP